MTKIAIPTIVSVFLFFATCCGAQLVTLTANKDTTNSNAELKIHAYQVAELVSLVGGTNNNLTGPHNHVVIEKNGVSMRYFQQVWFSTSQMYPLIITGPATFTVVSVTEPMIATFKISPEPYPPDKSEIIPPGAGGAIIALQSSSDLKRWEPATNGVYTNLSAPLFFRLKVDRVPQ